MSMSRLRFRIRKSVANIKAKIQDKKKVFKCTSQGTIIQSRFE